MALANLIWMRLRRTGARFAKLAARVRAGELPAAARTSASGASDQPSDFRADRKAKRRRSVRPAERLPRGLAWLLRLVPEAAVYGSQLNHLLSDPEMVALLQAAPQMGRLLRPLCQMLGIRLSQHPVLHTRRMREAAARAGARASDAPSADAVAAVGDAASAGDTAPVRSTAKMTPPMTGRSRRCAARRAGGSSRAVRDPPGGLFEPV